MGCQTLSWKQASLSTICFGPGMTYLNWLESVCMMPKFPFPCECRPFGSATILGGYDRDGPQLYMIEPSGVAYRYFGAAIGKGRQAAKTAIEKLKLSEMTCREGIIAVAKIIYEVHDEAKDKAFELELSWVCDESNKQHQRVPADLLEEAKAAAKAAKDALDEDEGMDAD
jgi:20S proteasome subunit alpha 7